LKELAFGTATILALVPTLLSRSIIYGGLFRFGSYTSQLWDWSAPHWREVLFSSDHGALSWTPILALAILGLFVADRHRRVMTMYVGVCAVAFYYVIACYPYWDGLASFGNRFLISLTSVFVFGLALLFEKLGKYFQDSGRAFVAVAGLVALLAAWNAGLIFQWGEHLIPVRGDISFREMTHNQVFVVPRQVGVHLKEYLFSRKSEMRDMEQLREHPQK
jgi:signal transduction histidine kinase